MSWDYFQGKNVLITGGTGSFGQYCARTLLERTGARRVIVFSRDELKQSQMASTFAAHRERTRFFLGDVRDLSRLTHAFHGVDYVIHAAALKQVPVLEYNPFEAILTNVIGTQNVVTAAIQQNVQKVLLVSTDKAANPANLYGATKLCAERLIVSSNAYAGGQTKFAGVRYGNVLGSRGSLLHVIEEQRCRGEILLTHEDMTRFWITLEQGVQLVLDSLGRMHGGEIFIPKIPSMRVKDLITAVAPECTLKVVGIRPGEKIHEVLVTPEEARNTREFDTHYVILSEFSQITLAQHYAHGQPVPLGSAYASNTNAVRLDEQGLKAILGSL